MRHIAFLLLLSFATACGFNTAPVLDVHDAKVMLPAGVQPSASLTRDAIVRALAERTWTVEGEEANTIVARVTAGGHSAIVGITYSEATYSIKRLESSPGLKYDGYEIHRRYNLWVKNLRATIDKHLSMTSPGAAPTSGDEAVLPPAEPPTGPVTAPPAGEVPHAADPTSPAAEQEKMPPLPPPATK